MEFKPIVRAPVVVLVPMVRDPPLLISKLAPLPFNKTLLVIRGFLVALLIVTASVVAGGPDGLQFVEVDHAVEVVPVQVIAWAA
jgi:hypothetical protein